MKKNFNYGRIFIYILIIIVMAFMAKGDVGPVTFNSPADNYWTTSGNNMTFNCSATATGDTNVTSITLLVWNTTNTSGNSTALQVLVNSTSADYGYSNESAVNGTLTVNFTVTNLTEMDGGLNWSWNCYAAFKDGNYSYNTSNRTFGLDSVAPAITMNWHGDTLNRTIFSGPTNSRAFQFSFNVSDSIGALSGAVRVEKNCSLYLNGAINETNTSTHRNGSMTNFSITSLDIFDDTLEWYVQCFDNASNSNVSSTFIFDTLTIATTHAGVNNDTWFTNTSPNGFNCSATPTTPNSVNRAANISSMVFMVWNATSGAQAFNYSINVSGAENGTWSELFNITGYTNLTNASDQSTDNGTNVTYKWNCLAYDNNSNAMFNVTSNRTFAIDTWDPNITSLSPVDGDSDIDGSTTFIYVVSDVTGENGIVNNCTLSLNNVLFSNTTTITDTVVNFTITTTDNSNLEGENVDWYIYCYDKSGRRGASGTRQITVAIAASGGSGDTDTGGGASDTGDETETEELVDIEDGGSTTARGLGAGESHSFRLSGIGHSITVDSADSVTGTATITIRSAPVTSTFTVGQEKQFDLNDNGIDDTMVKLLRINVNNEADFRITGLVETQTTSGDDESDTTTTAGDTSTVPSTTGYVWIIVIVAIVIIAIILFSVLKKKK
ncbi:MAG: hypothetical protein ABIH25_01815 [Candidatus Woesearchaeota archaeon]